jgi:hypothetical protein
MVSNEYDFGYNITVFFHGLQLFCGKKMFKEELPRITKDRNSGSAACAVRVVQKPLKP